MSDRLMQCVAGIILVLPLFAATAHGAAITVTSATVQRQHQEQATLCVGLALRGNEQIAGTENELVWDEDCASLLEGSCTESGSHGKKLSGVIQKQRAGTYKALLLSFSDTDPMPAGPLYCCEFLVHANPGSCCRVRVTNQGASDPDGNALPVEAGPPGQLCVASDGRGVGGSGGLGGGGLGSGGTGNLGGGGSGDVGGTGNLGGGTGNLGGGTGNLGGSTGGGTTSGGGNTVLSGGGAQDLADGDEAPSGSEAAAAAGGDTGAGEASAGGAPGRNMPQPGVDMGANPAAQSGGPTEGAPSGGAAPAAAPKGSGPSQMRPAAAAPAVAATPLAGQPQAATPGMTPPSDATAAATVAAAEPTTQAVTAADRGDAAAGEAEKPSPRDVVPVAAQGGAARPRRMPLDEEEGWFGCQTTGAGGSVWPAVAPLLLLLLARRRRRI